MPFGSDSLPRCDQIPNQGYDNALTFDYEQVRDADYGGMLILVSSRTLTI